ncbi:unnamed protein product [Arabis nemorensis]|uniref:F-box associated beta-propeller type 3 domain-containing protein n=1 Tax=Arabis nemorensis TaxID=586526 RepID=A0A565B4S5_9BRAS|nr:unnamed protein product [Arabis nemorensis]
MWSSIIRSPKFVRSFFSISSTRPRFVVALSNGIFKSNEERLVFLFSYEEGESSSLVPNFDMALPCVGFRSLAASCPSLHGFLAVKALGGLIICNPSTEQFVKFPDPVLYHYVGYDPIDDQHKALSVSLSIPFGPVGTPLVHKVLTIGQDRGWRHIETSLYHHAFLYSLTSGSIVCFHVRSDKLTYIKAPPVILDYGINGSEATFIEYKGKLASIVADPYNRFQRFDLWILEDVEKHEWSKKTCEIPLSVWDSVGGFRMSFPGTNKAGEIIMAPTILSRDVRPFYIFYYNVETRNTRIVRLQGIGDNQEFRRSCGFIDKNECHVRISPQHIESIASFKNPTT